jgi:hypothetical protein
VINQVNAKFIHVDIFPEVLKESKMYIRINIVGHIMNSSNFRIIHLLAEHQLGKDDSVEGILGRDD